MSARITARSLAAFLVAQACPNGWNLDAAESPAPGGLEKLAKDLEAVRALPDGARQTAPGLSGSALPDWQGAEPAAPPARRATGSNPGRDTKPTNWLLEAMNPPSSTVDENRAVEGKFVLPNPTRHLSGNGSSPRANSEKTAMSTEAPNLKMQFGEPGPPNPFAQFLGGWMTPQDYALLKPAQAGDSNLGAPSRGPDSPASGGSNQSPGLSNVNGIVGVAVGSKKSAPSPTPRENPYIQALTLPGVGPVQPTKVSMPSSISPARPAISGASVQPPVTTAAPAKAPDLPAVSDDEKYFKQLKRF